MAYESGEFLINQDLNNYNEFQSAAAIFNNNLVIMTSWGENNTIDLVQTVFPLKDLMAQNPDDPDEPVSDHGLKSKANWTSTDILQATGSTKPALAALPASDPDTLFTFYCSKFDESMSPGFISLTGIRGIRFPLNDQDQSKNNQWSPAIQLLDSDGINKPMNDYGSADICTTVVGDNMLIISCASAAPYPKGQNFGEGFPGFGIGTFVGIYDKTKIDFDNNEWKAEYSIYLPYHAGFKNTDTNRVLLEWFPQVTSAGTLEYHLLLITLNEAMDDNNLTRKMSALLSPMTISDKGAVTLTGFNQLLFQNSQHPPAPYFLATLNRDPTGRLRSWFSAGNNKTFVAYNLEVDLAVNQISFTPTTNTIVASEDSGNSVSPSAALVYIATESQYAGKIPATKPGGYPDLKTNNYPVYEFVFYGEYPKCQVKRLATIQTVTDPEDNPRVVNLQKSEDNPTSVYIIGGIFNGPIPYPLENYKGYNPGSSETSAGTLTYGTNSKTIVGRKA